MSAAEQIEGGAARLLAEGDPVTLYDRRRRAYSAILRRGGRSDLRGVRISHDEIIGQRSGCRIFSSQGDPAWAFAATLREFSLALERAATIVYPKDAAALLSHGDIGPGMRVLEAGLGSGALSIALLRAIGPTGALFSYERRPAAIAQGRANVRRFLGEGAPHEIIEGDIYEGFSERALDRIVLDLPEPWRLLPAAAEALTDGGILVAYLPTVLQVHQHILAARAHPDFFISDAVELLERSWHIAETSARPAHQMVGHTGFLCFSRRIGRPPERTADIAPAVSRTEVDEGAAEGIAAGDEKN